MKSGKNRRKLKRWQVTVLVRCSFPKYSDDVIEMEMWARDVNEKGIKLEWTKGLGVSQIPGKKNGGKAHSIRFEDVEFTKGSKILVQDLFYDDEGSPFMEGQISWVRHNAGAGTWALGIEFEREKSKAHDKMGAFKDFLSIVKNPMAAIQKATRKR